MSADSEIRAATAWSLQDFGVGRGLEVGPLYTPLLDKQEVDVSYLDVVDTPTLRGYYADDPRVPDADIVEVDFALTRDGVVRSMTESVGDDGPYDWILASHVIEHVPDVIGWLDDVASVVRPGGTLVLVVPDKRYTFDLNRPTTTVGAMIQAHADRDEIASIRAVHDHFYDAVVVDTMALWSGNHDPSPPKIYSEEEAARYVALRGHSHVDPHVWVFTPEVMVAQLRDLRRRGLSSWYVDALETTARGRLEFFVRLRRTEPGEASVEIDDEVVVDGRPHWLVEQSEAAAEIAELRRQVGDLHEQVDRLTTRVVRQRRRVRRLRRRLTELEQPRRRRLGTRLWRRSGRA